MIVKKKLTLLTFTTILAVSTLLAGCSSNNAGGSASSAPSETPKVAKAPSSSPGAEAGDKWVLGAKPLSFTAYSHYGDIDFPKWDSKPAGKWLKENKQVDITMITANGLHEQKLSTMISSNDLPDMIWTQRDDPMVEKLRLEGKLVAYDDYLDKYPNLKTWMGDNLNFLRADDGKLYRFPNWYTGRPAGNAGYVVNKKIYEELGSPKLETTDDLYDYLVKVKEKYGNSITPLELHMGQNVQGFGVIYTAFGEGTLYSYLNRDIRGVPKDNKLTSLFTDPVFREAHKYLSKLFREKLISQDAFTQTQDNVKEKVLAGRVAVYASSSPTVFAMEGHNVLTKNDPNAGYFMIWPIHKAGLDKNKIYPGTYTTLGWNASYITTAAKDPEAIFAFLDYMTSPEGMNLQFFGPEGEYWKGFDADGKPNFTDKYNAEEVAKLQKENDAIMFAGNTGYIDPAKMKLEAALPPEKQNWSARYQSTITWPTQYDVTEFIQISPSPDSELGIMQKSFDEFFLQVYANVITNTKSDAEVDQVLDKAEKDAQALGYGKILEYRTQKWQENKAKIAGKK
ncbi:extracellular solute-binding protein [Paenibacillus albiflavus]|uniref:Extracellular solute-binding protein n=1 Tax=Paenibacillus albiflavus TaxID=2545760 RepID=A0A4R4E8H2_9BACL|nr:extracellular solute-binding protein [Paenibacillus albiflavus]TCZ75263.1 extracellular solute-binding protein [Paenibacillus albiflavus]